MVKSNSIEDRIKNSINDCSNSNWTIDITKLTDFKWDKMYVFHIATGPDEISGAIEFNYPYYEEFSRSIVFVNKGKIVHYE